MTILFLACNPAFAQNYIRYHQKSLRVQKYMLAGDTSEALQLLNQLDRKYGLMPTETFALALCQFAIGDTAEAHRAYMRCMEQHGLLVWLYIKPPTLKVHIDSIWYFNVVKEAEVYRHTHPEFIEGPAGSEPTVLTHMNKRHQDFLDSIARTTAKSGATLSQNVAYEAIQHAHDAILDSLITGKLEKFTVAKYGVNTALQTFLLHVSPGFMIAHQKQVYQWLKHGLIYPDTYAACVDGPAYRMQRTMTYKFYRSSDDTGVKPGYEKRRWRIGMGNDRLNALRFVRPE